MQSISTPTDARVVILATGGTIAGTATSAEDTLNYRSAQLSIADLIRAVPGLGIWPLEAEQVAQIDSKDMDFEVWSRLARRTAHHLARPEVSGIVITHGSDTMEETAYLLARLLAPSKPVLLTGAMRPATATLADGPQNLLDAVSLARHAPADLGVCVLMAGQVLEAGEVRKLHTTALDALRAGDAGPLGRIKRGVFERSREAAALAPALGLALLDAPWPRVEIVLSHAGADGRLIDELVDAGVDGLVIAGTGNGTLHQRIEVAAQRALAQGVVVRRSTRVALGGILGGEVAALPTSKAGTAVQARIELMLDLMQTKHPRHADL